MPIISVIKGEEGKILYTSSTFWEMEDRYNVIVKNSCSQKQLEDSLNEFQIIPLFSNYYFSKYAASLGDYCNAAKYMDSVLQEIESNEFGAQLLNVIDNSVCMEIFGNAGQIYANNNEHRKALRCYQNYELLFMQTKSCVYSEGLFSFRSFNEYSLSDLINNEVTVCSPSVMNDPYDTLLLKWGENIRSKKSNKQYVDDLCRSFEPYRIRSFCTLKDNEGINMISKVLMWSHYADNHKGFCVKYKFSDHFPITRKRGVSRFKRIQYHPRETPFDLNCPSIDTNQALCTKYYEWTYESEIRLITYFPDKEGPYLSIPLDNDSYIESIFFGYRCPEGTIKTVKKALSYNPRIQYFTTNSEYNDIYRLTANLI